MSTTYKIVEGDTFEKIARKNYGSEKEAWRILKSNPGFKEPLVVGASLVIPDIQDAPQDTTSLLPASYADEVAILINGNRFRFFDKVRITRSLDKIDSIELGAPFEHSVSGFRENFRPFSFASLAVTVGGEPLFTGTMVDVIPVVENEKRVIAVSGYSRPGAMGDCTPPASSLPLEFNEQGLRDIAAAIAAPFGISVDFRSGQGAVFERVSCEPGKKAAEFLIDLAKQRNLVISSTERGKLLFWRSVKTGSPVAVLRQGESPLLSAVPSFSPQEYHSSITGIEPVIVGLNGSQYTVKNPHLNGVVRPLTFSVPDTESADVKTAVEAKSGRMFGNMAAYTIKVSTWRDPAGKLWAPNTTVKLSAPDAMIYTEYEFIIRSVEFERDSEAYTATLVLVIPGSFEGVLPEALPWDD